MALANYFTAQQPMAQQGYQPTAAPPVNYASGLESVSGTLQSLLSPNSSYIANARQRGIEQAATRGGVNSSIAAGASERAAIEAAAPLVQQATALQQNQQNFQMQDWLANQNFGRNLFTQKFSTTLDMLNNLNQMALMDPELYTPDVTSGMANFFQKNMNDIIKNYF